MYKNLHLLLTAYFDTHKGNLASLEAAASSLPEGVQEELAEFKASPFYPDKIASFLSARSSAVREHGGSLEQR